MNRSSTPGPLQGHRQRAEGPGEGPPLFSLDAKRRQQEPSRTRPELVLEEVASAEELGEASTASPNHGGAKQAAIALHSDSSLPPTFSFLEGDEQEQWNPLFWAIMADLLTVIILIAVIPFMLSTVQPFTNRLIFISSTIEHI
ncbi:hypothetical protein ACSSS7_000879 [Eimeria intestinalis]